MSNRIQQDAPDQSERDRILTELDRSLLVEAAAGTGKTTMMVDRMVALLRRGKPQIHNVAAITFTRKAAAEIRSRFQSRLQAALRDECPPTKDRLAAALANIERCFIGTVHSFCARLLRERPVEARVDVSFRETDDDEDAMIRRKAWDTYVGGLYANNDPILIDLHYYGLDTKDLWHAFNVFANFPDVDEWPVDPPSPVDFDEIRELLTEVAEEGRRIGCFIEGAYTKQDDLMRRYTRVTRMIRQADLQNPAQLVALLGQLRKNSPGVDPAKWPHGEAQAREEQAGWNEYRERALRHLAAWSRLCYPTVLKVITPARSVYDRLRDELGVLNYQDLLLKAAALLRENPHVRQYFKRRFTHILVDEFQDTDPVQAEVMMLLTATAAYEKNWQKCLPEEGSLFVVGDPKQSIYRFRRADIVTYDKVKKILDHDGKGVVRLQANFRSSGGIVQWVNATFKDKFKGPSPEEPEYVDLQYARSQTQFSLAPAVIRHTIPEPLSKGSKEEIVEHEATSIAGYIRSVTDAALPMPRSPEQLEVEGKENVAVDDFLIVTVKKKHLGVFADKLQKFGIPHQVTGGNAMNQCAELALLGTCLSAVIQPDNPVALVAALRSELFGTSDNGLYEFKKAGGNFSFLSEFPQGFNSSESAAVADAMDRLRRYYELFRNMPPVPALELMIADLGLPVSAALAAEGNFRSGSLMKALELLRSAQDSAWAVKDLADYLQSLAEGQHQHDAIPALGTPPSAVQVMNLHKAKGLEAPVVFLADPSGVKDDHRVSIHIDRSGEKTKGFLALHDPNQEFYPPELAVPAKWEDWQAAEKKFQAAENNRLMYVATTRARDQLVVVHREKYNNRNPWKRLGQAVKDLKTEFLPPANVIAHLEKPLQISDDEVSHAERQLRKRWEKVLAPTYAVAGVKAISVDKKTVSAPGRQHGTEWGTVIHTLLEAAMVDGHADLRELATSVLREQGFDDPDDHLEAALETVRSVKASPLWTRARKSPRCLVEVPFQLPTTLPSPDGTPVTTILRGAIDLVFMEAEQWVIADYKTDSVPRDQLPALVDHYKGQVAQYAQAWESVTGAKVAEKGLYFTRWGEYVTC